MTSPGELMLTVLLRHDQNQHLEQAQEQLDRRGWWTGFPPEGCEIMSWVVAMGIGQIVTLRLPAERLNEVNVELERRAWGCSPPSSIRRTTSCRFANASPASRPNGRTHERRARRRRR